jgi:tetratricopeptide (TPR) repeat protein
MAPTLEQVIEAAYQRRQQDYRDAILRTTNGRGLWIALGLEPPADMPAPTFEISEVERALMRAGSALTAKRSWEAVDWAEQALAARRTNEQAAEALRVRAAAWAQLGHYGDAVADAQLALLLEPDGQMGPVDAATLRAALPTLQRLWAQT